MKNKLLIVSTVLSFLGYSQEKQELAPSKPVTENYFGTKIEDTYRNLEDLKDESTLSWIRSQANYTASILNAIPGKQELIDKMIDIDGRAAEVIFSVQILEDNTYMYQKITPQDQIAKLYKRKGIRGKESLVFDPTKFDKETKDVITINGYKPNKKGSLVAINLTRNGGEMAEMIVLDIKTNSVLKDAIDKIRFGTATWLKDDQSFIYRQSITSDIHDVKVQSDLITKIHVIGTNVEDDKVVFTKAKYPELSLLDEEIPYVSYDEIEGKLYLLPYTVNPNLKVFMADVSELNNEKINWKLLCDRKDEVRNFFQYKEKMYFLTSLNAPNFKVVQTNATNINLEKAKAFIDENTAYKIETITYNKDGIYFTTNKNGIETNLNYIGYDGSNRKEIKTPKKSATIGVSVRGVEYSDIWVVTTGWTTSGERYKYNLKKNAFTREELSSVVSYPEFDNFEVEEIMIQSHDGIKVPLSLIYKKGIKKDGNNPTLIYGYGAYGISMRPVFNPSLLLWVEQGGVLAVAHVRGGGELGKNWHLSGQKITKPNTWKDAIACTEYLIKEGYTNNTKTAIYSRSAGGIFVGRAITERPDLFAAAIPGVGSMNPTRIAQSPNGLANMAEFGNPNIEEEFKSLLEMDSYHHLKKGVKYPAVLTTAGFNDPRIIVWEPSKFAAKLLEVNASNKPTLLKVDYEAGHFGGASKAKGFEETADVLAFAFWQLGHTAFQPVN